MPILNVRFAYLERPKEELDGVPGVMMIENRFL
jgi:hypothetical protein